MRLVTWGLTLILVPLMSGCLSQDATTPDCDAATCTDLQAGDALLTDSVPRTLLFESCNLHRLQFFVDPDDLTVDLPADAQPLLHEDTPRVLMIVSLATCRDGDVAGHTLRHPTALWSTVPLRSSTAPEAWANRTGLAYAHHWSLSTDAPLQALSDQGWTFGAHDDLQREAAGPLDPDVTRWRADLGTESLGIDILTPRGPSTRDIEATHVLHPDCLATLRVEGHGAGSPTPTWTITPGSHVPGLTAEHAPITPFTIQARTDARITLDLDPTCPHGGPPT